MREKGRLQGVEGDAGGAREGVTGGGGQWRWREESPRASIMVNPRLKLPH